MREQLLVAGRGRDRAIRVATLLTLVGLLLLLFLGVALLEGYEPKVGMTMLELLVGNR